MGARFLSTRELMAVLVGSGGARGSALDVADALIAFGVESLRRLAKADVAALERVPGVGAATAARVLAAMELGRRLSTEEADPKARIRGAADVYTYMGAKLRDLPQEEFHALLLDAQHRVLRDVFITRGILDAALVHPREVFRAAIVEGAAAVVLVHNHPSGDPAPSAEDEAVTLQMLAAGRALGIPVLDHVVVGGKSWASAMAGGGA